MVICRYNILNITRMLILGFMHRFGFELRYGGRKIGIMSTISICLYPFAIDTRLFAIGMDFAHRYIIMRGLYMYIYLYINIYHIL